jgi:hypothetical protein
LIEEKEVEKITASLGHIIRQKNVKSARDDNKRREWGVGFGICQGRTRERARKDGWIVQTLNSGSGKNVNDNAQKEKEKEKKTSCYIVRVLRICALAGMRLLRKNKGMKENERERSWVANTDAH